MIRRYSSCLVVIVLLSFVQLGSVSSAKANEVEPDAYESFPHLIPEINDLTGAARQNISIAVPPGRSGIQPDLSFSYSSFRKNGYLGVGWQIHIDAIQRRTRDGIHYDRNDFTILKQDKRIDLVDIGNDRYRARIEIDYNQYYFNRAANHWVITRKDGTKFYFGYRAAALSRQTNAQGTFLWRLDRVEDTNHNYMTIDYLQDQGRLYPQTIQYTGNRRTGDPPYNRVVFDYEPGTAPLAVSYISGARTAIARRLSAVRALSYDSQTASSQLALEYRLEYDQSPSGGQSRLRKIRIIGSDGRTQLPSYVFTYKNGQIGTWTGGPTTNDLLSDSPMFFLSDLNGDNKDDLIQTKGGPFPIGGNTVIVRWGNGDGTFHENAVEFNVSSNVPYLSSGGYISSKRRYFVDVNNDARTDYVWVYAIWSHGGENSDEHIEDRIDIALSDDSGRLNFNQTIILPSHALKPSLSPVAFIDFTNDGHTDIYAAPAVFENDGSGNFSQAADRKLPPERGHKYFADVNGDGLSDLINMRCITASYPSPLCILKTYHGDGAGNFIFVNETDNINMQNAVIRFHDVNHDSQADLILFKQFGSGLSEPHESGRYKQIYLSDGNGNYEYLDEQRIDGCTPAHWNCGNLVSGDLNGDGILDYVKGYYKTFQPENGDITVTENKIETALSQDAAPFDLLDTAASPSGVKMTYQYRSSSQVADQHFLPFNFYTVQKLSVDDGVSLGPSVNSYLHQWGYYDAAWKEFRGFEISTRTHPDDSVTRTYFYLGYEGNPNAAEDNDFYKNQIRQVDKFDAPAGALLSRTVYSWNKVESPTHSWAFVKLERERTEFYDDQTVYSQKEYIFDDDTGHLTQQTASGTGADAVVTSYGYTNYSADAWDPLWRRASEKRYYLDQPGTPARNTLFVHYAATGNLKQKIEVNDDPNVADSIWQYEYHANGNLWKAFDANGHAPTIYASYDATQTYPTLIANPLGHETRQAWDTRYGKQIRVQDQNGLNNGFSTRHYHDAFGRPQRTDYPDGGQTILEYNDYCSDPNCTNVVLPRKVTQKVRTAAAATEDTVFYFDGLNRKVQSVQNGEGGNYIVNKIHYNNMGLKYYQAGPFFHGSDIFLDWEHYLDGPGYTYPVPAYPYTSTVYDKRGRPTSAASPDGQNGTATTHYAYSGFATKTTDPDNCAKTEIRDHLGRIIQVIDHAQNGDINTAYIYNAADDLQQVRNHFWSAGVPDENRILMVYDTLGRKTGMDDPDMGPWSYQYDPNGNLVLQTDAKGQRIQFTYDALDRIERKDYPDTPDPSVTYQYDEVAAINGIGRLYHVSNTHVTSVHPAYDPMGRPTEMHKTIVGQPLRTTLYDYDYAGRVTRLTYPHTDASSQFHVDYAFYPGTGLLHTAIGSDGTVYAALSNYTPGGKIGHIALGNNAHTTYGYDEWTGRLTAIHTQAAAGAVAQDRTYAYSPAGDIEVIDDLAKVETYYYSYDKLHRLVSETTSSGSIGVTPAIMEMNYDDADHIHAISSVVHKGVSHVYGYDANGNMQSGPDLTDPTAPVSRNLTFNADNMPLRVVHPTGGTVSFVYDGHSRRAKKTAAGRETYYFSKEFEIIANVETHYVFAGNLRVAMVKDGRPTYFHKDHLGSSTAMTDAAGNIIETAMYMPFGAKRGHGGITVNAYLFTDQELDKETGLYNYDARLYDPIIGRFVSADSIVPGRYDSQAFDRYAYSLNNPIKYTDPDGHFAVCATLGAIGAYSLAKATISLAALTASAILGDYLGSLVNEARNNNSTSSSYPYGGLSTGQLNKAEKSYNDLINEHQQKLDDYKQNPDAYDNQGKLKNVSPEMREKIVQGRIKSLEKQIQKQKNELDKIRDEKESRKQKQEDKEGQDKEDEGEDKGDGGEEQ